MATDVAIEERPDQAYMAVRVRVVMSELGGAVAPLFGEVYGWVAEHGATPAGPPFLRYLIVDMESELEVDVAVPVIEPLAGDGRVVPGRLPGGRYAVLVHLGDPRGLVDANAALQDWCRERGLTWPMEGDRWQGRIEVSLTNPADQPDPSTWETEVAYLVEGDPTA